MFRAPLLGLLGGNAIGVLEFWDGCDAVGSHDRSPLGLHRAGCLFLPSWDFLIEFWPLGCQQLALGGMP